MTLKQFVVGLVVVIAAAAASVQTAQNPPAPTPPQGRGRGPAPVDTLGTGPWDLQAGRGVRIHVTAIKGLDHPWGIAFPPDGSMLVTARGGQVRVIRNNVVDPTPLAPVPEVVGGVRDLGGMLDVTLHPQFA